jgi:integral membrane protein
MSINQIFKFRLISYFEGISYLFLVFVVMPLKYLGDNLIIMKIVGMVHGLLFIFFCISLYAYIKRFNINKDASINYFIYSLSPFGFLLIENSLKEKGNNNESI